MSPHLTNKGKIKALINDVEASIRVAEALKETIDRSIIDRKDHYMDEYGDLIKFDSDALKAQITAAQRFFERMNSVSAHGTPMRDYSLRDFARRINNFEQRLEAYKAELLAVADNFASDPEGNCLPGITYRERVKQVYSNFQQFVRKGFTPLVKLAVQKLINFHAACEDYIQKTKNLLSQVHEAPTSTPPISAGGEPSDAGDELGDVLGRAPR